VRRSPPRRRLALRNKIIHEIGYLGPQFFLRMQKEIFSTSMKYSRTMQIDDNLKKETKICLDYCHLFYDTFGALHVSSFWLLRIESCDFSHAGKERTACKAELNHKRTLVFTQGHIFCTEIKIQNSESHDLGFLSLHTF